MMVDLPEPDGPHNATVWPAGMTKLYLLQTGCSGADGYAKVTSTTSIRPLTEAGIDVAVAGSAVFNQPDYAEAISALKAAFGSAPAFSSILITSR